MTLHDFVAIMALVRTAATWSFKACISLVVMRGAPVSVVPALHMSTSQVSDTEQLLHELQGMLSLKSWSQHVLCFL